MQKPQDGYRSMGGKRRILVVDDEEINREILGMILSDDYEVLYAEDGEKPSGSAANRWNPCRWCFWI